MLVLTLALTLSGCMMLQGDLEIHTDDTVSGTVVVGLSQDWSEGHGQDPMALQQILTEELELTPDAGVSGEPYADEDFIGMELTLTEVEISRVAEATNDALIISRDDDGYVVGGRFTDLDTTAPEADGDGEVPTPWAVDLSITFPEAVTDQDGTLVGRTVSWQLEPGEGEDTMYATTGGSSFSLPIPVPVLILALLMLGGGAVIWFSHRRRRARR